MSATNNPPLKNYGFRYEHEGASFVFHIVAGSEQEAKDRLKSMGRAVFEGELHAANESHTPDPLAALKAAQAFLAADRAATVEMCTAPDGSIQPIDGEGIQELDRILAKINAAINHFNPQAA